MKKQSKSGISNYYGVLRIVLIFLILGRLIGIVSMITEFNKPVDEGIVEILNDRGYKIFTIVSAILDILLLIVFYHIVSVSK